METLTAPANGGDIITETAVTPEDNDNINRKAESADEPVADGIIDEEDIFALEIAEADALTDKSENKTPVIKAGPGDLSQAVDIGWLDLDKAEFYEGTGGFTGLRYGDKEYKRIQLRRAMPDRYPSEYISVADHENNEIGMIKALTDLRGPQLGIVSNELDRRYYCPEIIEVKSVRDKLGYVYMEMDVFAGGERHERSAAVNDVNKNIRMIGANRLIIFDVDGNRFIINALDKLDGKSLRRLEPYMF